MREAVVAQELERAVGGDRRRPRALQGEALDDFVGAERLVRPQQRRQHLTADRGEALAALGAQRLGDGHGVGRAAVVIVIGGRKNRPPPPRWVTRRFGFRHAPRLAPLTVFRSSCHAIIYVAMQQFASHIQPFVPHSRAIENVSYSARKSPDSRAQAAKPRGGGRSRSGAQAGSRRSRSISPCRAAARTALSPGACST